MFGSKPDLHRPRRAPVGSHKKLFEDYSGAEAILAIKKSVDQAPRKRSRPEDLLSAGEIERILKGEL